PYLWWGLAVLVAGGFSIAAGIMQDVDAAKKYNDYRKLSSEEGIADFIAAGGTREEYVKKTNGLLDEGDASRYGSIITYAFGAALAATGVTLMVWWKDTPVEQVSVAPTQGGAILTLSGSF
ncbi:MAG TPA: hypothetical protein PKH10_09380, partial [bacterium]|nr:hypothetical protein [bacterium]